MGLPATITVAILVPVSVEDAWTYWTVEEHITKWNFASPEWCCPFATNDVRPDGRFSWRMEAKDGSVGFDFTGTYISVKQHAFLDVRLDDGRLLQIEFSSLDGGTRIQETFEAEKENPVEMQKAGWQSILNNFKLYVESVQT